MKQLPQRNLKWLLVVNWGILVEKRVFFPLLLPLVWSSQSVPKLFSAVMWSRKSPCLKTSALPVGNGSRCKFCFYQYEAPRLSQDPAIVLSVWTAPNLCCCKACERLDNRQSLKPNPRSSQENLNMPLSCEHSWPVLGIDFPISISRNGKAAQMSPDRKELRSALGWLVFHL